MLVCLIGRSSSYMIYIYIWMVYLTLVGNALHILGVSPPLLDGLRFMIL